MTCLRQASTAQSRLSVFPVPVGLSSIAFTPYPAQPREHPHTYTLLRALIINALLVVSRTNDAAWITRCMYWRWHS